MEKQKSLKINSVSYQVKRPKLSGVMEGPSPLGDGDGAYMDVFTAFLI
jgi:hypothetical protein